MFDALERRAVAAVRSVVAAHGLSADGAVVMYSGSNVLVHLRPLPIVARVMSGTVVLHDEPRRWLAREVAVLKFLAPSRVAVAPSQLIAPGPHQCDGLWMTFTELVPGVKARPEPSSGISLKEARAFGEALGRLHQELRAYRGALQGSCQLYEDIHRLLDHIHAADARQRDRLRVLRDRLQSLRAAVFDSSLPTQALHGDVSISNLLLSADRLIWNDFEDTFRGPVHWDLASAVGSLRVRGAEPLAVQELLFTYGWDNARELDPFLAAQDVYDEIWQTYDRQRNHA